MIQSGRDEVPYQFFSVLSFDIRILVMMLFPYIYLNKHESFGLYASSGIDIEIYIGIICVIYLLYAIRYHYRDRFVQLMIGIMTGAFLYGMAPSIPLIGKLIYNIPVLGSFRVSARILSVFLLCGLVLCGYTISKLDEKMEVKRLLKFSVYFTILIVGNAVIVASIFSQPSISDELSKYYVWNGEVFFSVVTLCLLNVVSLFLMYKYANEKKYIKQIVLGFLCLITIIDVGKYSIVKNKYPAEDILHDTAPSQIQELIKESPNYRSFALVKALEHYDNRLSLSKVQRGTIARANYYNNYITFVDEKLKKYNIDETLLYPKTIDNLKTRNDLISMMSIKYILDAWDQELEKSILIKDSEVGILRESNIQIPNHNSQLSVISYPIELEPNSTYKVKLKMNTINSPSLFYVDFYNDTYDHPEQDGHFNPIVPETKDYSVLISTGDEVPTNQVYFRIVSQSTTDIVVDDLSVSKMRTVEAYKQIADQDGVVVYENRYAKPILYVPKHVQSIDSYEPLYIGDNESRLDESSYIKDFGKNIDLTQVNTEISDLKRENNSVTATIISDKATFINHAQLSYPGWKAYVDDEEVPIYNVNDLIQGIEVPEGTHLVSFVFDPLDVKIGAIISSLGILLCGYYLFYNRIAPIFHRNRRE
ncbi:predicted membrane protein [Paenibacillus popilliae ATCC 14706]|uniref:Predicted membrane protein n=2 Tax=Paenibacillus popilliae TaxID=78057 RepID=M9M311_PAEPP|nr:predicted membrane protein [Paenibacillus popilliae ATCC 14706]